MPNPHHRLTAAQEAIISGKEAVDPKVRELVNALNNPENAKPALQYALRKFSSPYQRTVLNALFLGRATLEEVHTATEIPHEAIVAYGDYIFDETVFTDRLEKVEWVETQRGQVQQTEWQVLTSVLTVGVPFLVWFLTGKGQMTPARVLRDAMNDAFLRSQAHRLAPLDSATAKEAHNWLKTSERLAKALHAVDPQDDADAREQLQIALSHEDETVNEESTGIAPTDILH